jgi:dipeptidase E
MSRGPLILGGGGDEMQERPVWIRFLNAMQGPRLLYVPLALGSDAIVLSEAARWFRDALHRSCPDRKYAVTVAESWAMVIPHAVDGVFIGGGNTDLLMSSMRRSGADAAIRQVWNTGKPIYGGSAGAIVMGRRIDLPDNESLPDRSMDSLGLDMLGGLCCLCHYSPQRDAQAGAYARAKDVTVLALPEDGGAAFESGTLVALGPQPIVLFMASVGDKRGVAPGSWLRIEDGHVLPPN